MRYPEFLETFWLLPGFGASIVVAFLLRGTVERTLRTGPHLAWALLVSVGIIVSATLMPSLQAIEFGTTGTGVCDLSRIGLAPLSELLRPTEASANVLMFIPLGATISLVPRSRRKVAVVAAAIALPFAVEAAQLLMPALDRACESADVIDNLTGLTVGLVAGTAAAWVALRASRGRE